MFKLFAFSAFLICVVVASPSWNFFNDEALIQLYPTHKCVGDHKVLKCDDSCIIFNNSTGAKVSNFKGLV